MPQRFLRPGIRTSETWNRTSFAAQGLYVSILTLVDDFGRYDGRAALLHGECFALRNDVKPQRTAELLQELHDVGLVQLYQHEGKAYLQVLRWTERTRSAKSKFPDPPAVIPQDSAADGREKTLPSPSPSSPPLHHRPSPSVGIADGVCEEIYSLYPRRVAKPDAFKAIRKALGKVDVEFLKEKVAAYAQAVQGNDPQFIPYPATWLNDERYNDDPATWAPARNGSLSPTAMRTPRTAAEVYR